MSLQEKLVWSVITVIACNAVYVILLSLFGPLPLGVDAYQFHEAAYRMVHLGQVPYRDFWDMNWPGVFLLHGFILKVFGPGNGAVHAADLLINCFSTVIIMVFAVREDKRMGALALVCLVLIRSGTASADILQRETMLLPLLLLGGFSFSRMERPFVGLSGVAIGFAVMVKPVALPFLLLFALYLAAARLYHMLMVFACGFLLAALSFMLVISYFGALPDFLWCITTLTRQHAALLRGEEKILSAKWEVYSAFFLLTGVVAAYYYGQKDCGGGSQKNCRLATLYLCVVASALGLTLQRKGFYYHFYPPMLFLALWSVTAVEGAYKTVVAAVVTCYMTVLSVGGRADAAWYRLYAAQNEAETVELVRMYLKEGEDVLILEGAALCGFVAVREKRVHPVTRSFYDKFLFYPPGDPLTLSYEEQFMSELQKTTPIHVMVCGQTTHRYEESVASFPALARWMEGYTLVGQGQDLLLFERKSTSRASAR